eukprot:g1119.t1
MRLFLIAVIYLLLTTAPRARTQDCPCEDTPPDDQYTCEEQRNFGQCDDEWMESYCLCTCNRCDSTTTTSSEAPEDTSIVTVVSPASETEFTSEARDDISTTDSSPAAEQQSTTSEAPEDTPTTTTTSPTPETQFTSEAREEAPDDDEPTIERELPPLASFANRRCTDALLPAITGSSELTLLSAAIEAAELEDVFSDGTFRGTLFAPNNDAIESALENLGLNLNELADNTAVLTAVLQYHVVPSRVLSINDIRRARLLDTALAKYSLIGGSRREIEGYASVGRFIGDPVVICRSIVYLIDDLLLPEGSLEELNTAFGVKSTLSVSPESEEEKCREGFNAFFAISSDPELSTFAELLNFVQLSGPLAREANSFTVFAPTNEAFNSTLESLNTNLTALQEDEELLSGILQYHIINESNIEASDLQTSTLMTMNESTILVEVDKGIELSGTGSAASVIEADIDRSCESAVHKIDNVLLPFRTQRGVVSRTSRSAPVRSKERRATSNCQVGNKDLFQVISGTPGLTVWAQIIQLSGLHQFLSDESISVTMFAPNDAAFGRLLPLGSGFSELVPEKSMAKVLVSYHTVSGAATTRQINQDIEVETLLVDEEGEAVEIEIESNPLTPSRFTVTGKESSGNFVDTDIIGCNSVIHIIDGVLQPYKNFFPSNRVTVNKAISNAEGYTSLLEEANTENGEEEGPCLSTPEVKSPRRGGEESEGRAGPSSSSQPKKYSSKYKSRSRRAAGPSQLEGESPHQDYQQQQRQTMMMMNTPNAAPMNVTPNREREIINTQRVTTLAETRQLENEPRSTGSSTMSSYQYSRDPPRPLRPLMETEEINESMHFGSVEQDWTPDNYPENFNFNEFMIRLAENFEVPLLEKEAIQVRFQLPSQVSCVQESMKSVQGQGQDQQGGSTQHRKITSSSRKKLVTGETLTVSDRSKSQVNVEQEESGVMLTPDAPSTSSNAQSPLICSQQEINEEQLVEVKLLGTGASGRVYLSTWMGSEVAVKEFYDSNPVESERCYNQEAENLNFLKHPCVVSMYGVTTFHRNPAIVLEYIIGGSLKAQLRGLRQQNQGADVSLVQVTSRIKMKCQIALKASSAVEYLHSKQIIHFDLKAENFLCDLKGNGKPVVKVADVGLSKHKMVSYMTRNMRGTLPWMAPELLPGLKTTADSSPLGQNRVDQKVDIYSFGIVLWEIWTYGNDPYGNMSAHEALYGVLSGSLRPTIPRDCPASWTNLMQQCWDRNPVRRPTIDMVTKKLINFLQELR